MSIPRRSSRSRWQFLGSVLVWLVASTCLAQAPRFRRGDSNGDGTFDGADPVSLLGHLYLGGAAPRCRDAADSNDDGALDMSDAVLALGYLYLGKSAPARPFPGCGSDPTTDRLDCAAYGSALAPAPCEEVRPGADEAATLHHLTNLARAEAGLPPLKHNASLALAIREHCLDMGENDYFGHWSLDGHSFVQRIEAAGYVGTYLGENIAAGYLTPEQAIEAWMASDSHRANVLNPNYRELGAGHASVDGSTYGTYWGQDFGARPDVYPVVIDLEAPATRAREVSLYVHGSDWAQEMQVSNDPAFPGASWRPFQASLSWTLAAGAGRKTVHVKLRSGTKVLAAQDSIVLEE
ncbi:MAG: hypothetical protein HY721_00630 [Planctomycetes bacterium]|nr:hypothetical protein [Planctomycetota bacterium]